MTITHEELCQLIPHHGSMCLLDSVIDWGEESINCRSLSQCDSDNPLSVGGILTAVNGIEYAAQAMAVHGALLSASSTSPDVAYLAAIRGVNIYCSHLHDQPELFIHCKRLGGDSNGFIYNFEISNSDKRLLEGRATVIKQQNNNQRNLTA